MQKILPLIAFALVTSVVSGGEQPPDITGANKKTLDAHLGEVVSVRGTLGVGVHGQIVAGATQEVDFYVVTGIDPGRLPLPDFWTRLHHRQVRVTGTLRFRTFPRPPDGKHERGLADYYYMVLEQTQIQPAETK